jgi:hypothetical protein
MLKLRSYHIMFPCAARGTHKSNKISKLRLCLDLEDTGLGGKGGERGGNDGAPKMVLARLHIFL